MIKIFLQKHRAILLAIIITSASTVLIASGYFVIRNEKEKSNQKVEALQKSIEELQVKTEEENKNYAEAQKEPEKEVATPAVNTQQIPAPKKSVETVPAKTEVVEEEEKMVSCLTYAKITVQVSEAECNLIKQKNESSKEIDTEYQNCVSICEAIYRASIPVTSKSQYDSTFGSGAYDDKVSECKKKKDDCSQDCLNTRNSQMKKLWK